MADAIWESYRPELERLYIHEGQKLSEVREYMRTKYGFDERKSQYEKYFKRWGLRKNHSLTSAEGKFIGRRVDKRKREYQKESEVYVDGVQYPPSKLKKSRYNTTFVSTVDNLPNANRVLAPSPSTPEGIVVCTPATPGMRLIWNHSLPWLQFSKLLEPRRDDNLSSLPPALLVTSPQSPGALTNNINRDLMQRLGSIIPWKTLSHPPNINSLSRIVTGLSILMPEEFDGQHRSLATRLCNSPRTTTESLNLELFLLSNNFVSHGPTGKSKDTMDAHDRNVMKLLHMSGWKTMKHIGILLTTREPTAEAIAEKLFASALRLLKLNTVRMMLEAGMDPDSRVDTFYDGPLTCLQFAAQMASLEFGIETVELLLSHGADINLSYNDYPPLYYALKCKNTEAIRLFLSHNAFVTPSCLATAAEISDMDLFIEILDRVTDVNVPYDGDDLNPLARAVACDNLSTVNLLLSRGADINELLDIEFDNGWEMTTVVGLAVREKNLQIIQAMLQSGVNVEHRLHKFPCVSPLTLAVEAGDTGIAQFLLKAGFDIQSASKGWKLSLLERALKQKDVEMSKLLIEWGAQRHMAYSRKQQNSSALLLAVQNGYNDIVDMLVQAGAPLNEVYGDAPGTVLAAAIEKGDLMLIQMLESAGATIIGPKLRGIGNLELAMYLQERGVLKYILEVCGGRVLTRAISTGMPGLAHWLLAYDLDVDGNPTMLDISEHSETPLQAAIKAGSLSLVEMIMERGARVTDCDLAAAVHVGDIDLLSHLSAFFVGRAPTAIGYAIVMDKKEAIKLILDAGIEPTGAPQGFCEGWYCEEGADFTHEDPQSVLELAAQQDDRSTLQILLQYWVWDSQIIGRALTMAVVYQHTGLIDDILEQAVDMNQEIDIYYYDWVNEDGEEIPEWCEILTPLQAAVKNQLVSIVQWLVKNPQTNIDYLGEGEGRRTALQHAVNNGNMDLINLLLDHGANVNSAPSENGGATALQIAAIQGYLGIARKLIDLDADVNAAPAQFNGRTALEGAAEHGRIDMLRLLIDERASLVGKDGERQYRRAVELAENNGHMAAARLLKSFKDQVEESGT
ncbi:ankyrin [Aspergillus vadensis CBS 113365]|uniref:Ankyrin n=1 Tax=Aspergillus vadensis (strain CBS 113365 / IMI 142717 / IBT 24658) TaxID=1448311 RepID=A0A319B7K8_ASPVC|nr:ankyrin [Aspergillus vadensis CBS 113365]PYH66340.1 ankyrin [Aspergillus vadensis CBS 113365]